MRFLRTLSVPERRRREVSQTTRPTCPPSGRGWPSNRVGEVRNRQRHGRSGRVGGVCRFVASSMITGESCTVIVLRPTELRDRRVRDWACLEFRVYAVPGRLKAELRAASSTLCPPDQDGRGPRYASAYPSVGGVKAINSRPKAGIFVWGEVRKNRMSRVYGVRPERRAR